jgi:cytochrome c oxidase subunit 4
MADATTAPRSSQDHGEAGHIVPFGVLAGVFAVLMVLTALTVAAWCVDLGSLNIPIAIGIAVVKASFVALYFMHLRYDSPFNGTILVVAMVFVALFIIFSLVDTVEYNPGQEEFKRSNPPEVVSG